MYNNRPTIEEEVLMRRSRADWESMRSEIQEHIASKKDMSVESLAIYEDRVQYIDTALDTYYTSMCIRCGKKTPKSRYDAIVHSCMHCLKNIIYRVIDEMTDEERADFEERLDKQLEPKGE